TESIIIESEGYVKDGKATVEFRIWIYRVFGFREVKLRDFSTPDQLSNVVLVVEGKKLHLSRDYLATHSPVFSAMFFGDFVEKNKEEIELKDVAREEFVELLYVIYPSYRPITKYSTRFILVLADLYQIKYATNLAESYLIKTK
ncbi:hypothetical protein PFISCL1PPCAC_20981, partial [Pristionchus fissidentatus]